MKITTTRRISQIFFLILFMWFCVVTTLGDQWWQLRGWPVNWIIELDPLVGLATLLSTRTLYAGLLCRINPDLFALNLQLTYYQVDTGEEWHRLEEVDRDWLLDFLDDSLARMADWLTQEQVWRQRRDASLSALEVRTS